MDYQLDPLSIEAIDAANDYLEEEQLDGLQGKLLEVARPRPNQNYCADPLGLFMFWDGCESDVTVTCHSEEENNTSDVDVPVIASKIVELVQTGLESINLIIELVSNLTVSELENVVRLCSSTLHDGEHERNFIIAMSATRNSAVAVCSQFLLPVLVNLETFQKGLDVYGPVLKWLECNMTEPLVIPLLGDESSPLLVDIASCKAFCNTLTDSQKNDILMKYDKVLIPEGKLAQYQIQAMGTMIETTTLDVLCLPTITNILTSCMSVLSDDRLMGKIILIVLTALSPPIPAKSLSELTSIVGQFKGPLRFRHQQVLKKLSKHVS